MSTRIYPCGCTGTGEDTMIVVMAGCPLHDEDADELTEKDDIYVHRNEVCLYLRQLRYSNSVPEPMPSSDPDRRECDFLEDVRLWLHAFDKVLSAVSDTTTTMAAELAELRNQRKAVRDFLGLNQPAGEA